MLLSIICASFGSWISFISCLIAIFFVIITPPPAPSASFHESLRESPGGRIRSGEWRTTSLHQLLHPNEAALGFTKLQLITLQVISKQDCLQLLISAAHPLFTHNQQDGDEMCGRGGQKPYCFTLIISLTPMIRMALTRLTRGGHGVDAIGADWVGFTVPRLGRTDQSSSLCRPIVPVEHYWKLLRMLIGFCISRQQHEYVYHSRARSKLAHIRH